MAKRAKADQLGTGTQGLCCKPLRQARPWPERKSAPAPSRGATLTANANERTQPANRGQMVEGQGFRPSCADKVARRRLSNRPNPSGLAERCRSELYRPKVHKSIERIRGPDLFAAHHEGRQPY